MSKKTVGVICVLLASVFWGFEPILVRFANADFMQSITIRAIIISIIALLYALLTKKRDLKINREQ